ncbi:DUF7288 family protein [Halobaculum sp. D14]|uniref:DUF7288 family protein n=1 Tax=unclassified Halobaculum TaxID=2640896 RepID=UPI003EB6BE19
MTRRGPTGDGNSGLFGGRSRGQAHTLEGVMAALLVVIGVLLAYQAIVLTPTTAGTVDRDVTAHLGTRVGDVLRAANDDRAISRVMRYWNTSGYNGTGSFKAPAGVTVRRGLGYKFDTPPGRFGRLLNESFTQNGYVVNVYLEARDVSNPTETTTYPLIKRGQPTSNAAVASLTVTLYDYQYQTRLAANGTLVPDENSARLGSLSDDRYFAGDLDGPVYNVVTVKVVVW